LNAINPAGQAGAEAKRYGIRFPVLVCRDSGVVRDYKVTKLPHLFIVDHEGIIRESKLFLKEKKIKEILNRLIEELPESAGADSSSSEE
jgi:peroxiredoxin